METKSASPPHSGRVSRTTIAAALVALTGFAAGLSPAIAAEAGVTVSNGTMRTVIPSRPAAGYFTLANDGDTDRELTGAASPGCGSVMLHKSETLNGVDSMVMVDSVPVPAHQSVTFAPGGFHLMCMSPSASLTPGSKVPVTLSFKDGGSLTSDFDVRSAADQ